MWTYVFITLGNVLKLRSALLDHKVTLCSTIWGIRLPWWLGQWSVCLQRGRPGFNPWVGKILWRRKWQPTPVFLPGKSHGLRSLVSYHPWGHKESDTTEWLTHTHARRVAHARAPRGDRWGSRHRRLYARPLEQISGPRETVAPEKADR